MPPIHQTDDKEIASSDFNVANVVFSESVRASTLAFAFIGAVYVALIALFIGVPIVNGMEDSRAWAFYATTGTVIAVLSFFLVNFMVLRNTVSTDGLEFRFGILARRFAWSQVLDAETRRYRWLDYGGWGIRWVPGGRRAWSLFGVPEGVVVTGRKRQGQPVELLHLLRPTPRALRDPPARH